MDGTGEGHEAGPKGRGMGVWKDRDRTKLASTRGRISPVVEDGPRVVTRPPLPGNGNNTTESLSCRAPGVAVVESADPASGLDDYRFFRTLFYGARQGCVLVDSEMSPSAAPRP